jgi:hypothetical protein
VAHGAWTAAVIVRTPCGIDGGCIDRIYDALEQRMATIHTSIEDADSWSVGATRRRPVSQVFDPFGLFGWRGIVEACSSSLGESELGEIAEDIDGAGELASGGSSKNNDTVIESQAPGSNFEPCCASEFVEPLELEAVLSTQPDFPPDFCLLGWKDVFCVRPQCPQSGPTECRDPVDCLFVPWLTLLCLLL